MEDLLKFILYALGFFMVGLGTATFIIFRLAMREGYDSLSYSLATLFCSPFWFSGLYLIFLANTT